MLRLRAGAPGEPLEALAELVTAPDLALTGCIVRGEGYLPRGVADHVTFLNDGMAIEVD